MYAIQIIQSRQCVFLDAGPSHGLSTCRVLVELPGRHSGVFNRSVWTPGAPEEGSTSSYLNRDKDTVKEDQDFSIRSRVFRI